MENSPGHDAVPGAAVLCLPSTETSSLFQKCFVSFQRTLGFEANPHPGGETLLQSGLVGHSPGPFHRDHPVLSWSSQIN